MSSQQASRIVFLAGSIEAVYVLLRANKGGTRSFKSLWAIGVLTLGLAVAADFVPEVAGPFALLVLVAMIARNRGEIGTVISSNAAPAGAAAAGVPSTNARYAGSGRPG